MYASKISLAAKYNYLEEKFTKAYQWLTETDITALSAGAYPICDGVTANIQEYTTIDPSTGYFESHEKFFDIQYLVSGLEQFGVCNRDGLKVRSTDADNDLIFYEQPEHCGSILLTPGDFVVVAPEDAHKPRCIAGNPCEVKKVVVKVRV